MPCVTPGAPNSTAVRPGNTAFATMRHCENGYVYLEVEFERRNLGHKVAVQGLFLHEGENGWKTITRKVIVCDDGTVIGYGNTAEGIRFRQKTFDMRRAHAGRVDINFF